MTREEEIKLKIEYQFYKINNGLQMADDEEVALRLFEELKALSAEPCEDAISRQAVLDLIYNSWKHNGVGENYGELSIDALKALPPVTPNQKMGHWIDDTRLGYHVSICSNCDWRGHGDTCLIYRPKYCPNCGARME